MWNEHPQEKAFSSLREKSLREPPVQPALIEAVQRNSIGQDLGFQPGDKLLSINGIPPRDLIDYKYLIAEEQLELEVLDDDDKLHKIELDKNIDDMGRNGWNSFRRATPYHPLFHRFLSLFSIFVVYFFIGAY